MTKNCSYRKKIGLEYPAIMHTETQVPEIVSVYFEETKSC